MEKSVKFFGPSNKFEYRRERISDFQAGNFLNSLNAFGEIGWEVVNVEKIDFNSFDVILKKRK